jgi:hypothetical protein
LALTECVAACSRVLRPPPRQLFVRPSFLLLFSFTVCTVGPILSCYRLRVLTILTRADLAATIQDQVVGLLQRGATPSGRKPAADEVAETRAAIERNQRLLVQWAEEKVQLALTGHNLLQAHQTSLDMDIHALQGELAAAGLGDMVGVDDYFGVTAMDDVLPQPPPRRQGGGGGGRLPHAASYDSLDPGDISLSGRGGRRERGGGGNGLTISRPASGLTSDMGLTAADSLAWDSGPKRPQQSAFAIRVGFLLLVFLFMSLADARLFVLTPPALAPSSSPFCFISRIPCTCWRALIFTPLISFSQKIGNYLAVPPSLWCLQIP